MTEKDPSAPKLNPYTHGEKKVLDASAIDHILNVTGLPLQPRFNHRFIKYHLNDTVYFSISIGLFPDYNAKVLKKLRKYFDDYEKLSIQLQLSRDFPPVTPREWHQKTLKWFEEMEAAKTRGGRPKDSRLRYFLPRALGLYSTVFGATPTPTVAKTDSQSDGPTALFVAAIIEEAGRYIDHIDVDDRYTADQKERIRWISATGDALEAQLKLGLKIMNSDWKQKIQRPEWQIYAEFFESPVARR
jgi:hypothetical protein